MSAARAASTSRRSASGRSRNPTDNAGTSRASQAFWRVDDIEREVAELKHRGVKFEEYDMPDMKVKNSIYSGGGAKAAWFRDTEATSSP
jgi:hypothetical protein